MKRSFAILLAAALLLCLLPGMALEAKAETVRNICFSCKKQGDLEIIGFERYNDDQHYVIYKCPNCGKSNKGMFLGEPIIYHSGGAETPTCTTGKTCAQCGTQYGKLGHDWGAWQSKGNNSAHFRTCQRDGCDAVDTASCSGDSRATCIELGICTTCGGRYYGAHAFLAAPNWDSDAENHWLSCTVCRKAKTRVGEHYFVQGTLSSCLKSAATCVSPAVYYTNCAYCYHKGTDTYVDPHNGPARNNHDLVHHDAKAPTCTEIGWEEYDACQREGCTYTTKVELPALKHNLVHHDAKAPTCTEIGWDEYDTCTRCDYTTYAEFAALEHDYQQTIVKPTCEKDGYTRHTCARCEDIYTEDAVEKLYHWYGEWSPNGDETHSADCRREGCKHTGKTGCQKFKFQVEENECLAFCPVCGEVENGERLELIAKALATVVTGRIPAGEVVARMHNEYLSIAFEYAGKLIAPTGQVKITLPAELLEGKILTLIAPDGTETEIHFEIDGEKAFFTLDFTEAEIPVMLIRTNPEA